MKRGARHDGGFTLVELTVTTFVLSVIVIATGMAMQRLSSAYRTGTLESQLETDVHRAMDDVVRRLTDAGVTQLTPQPTTKFGADTLLFRSSEGYADGIVWGAEASIGLELAEGELDDGLDNNGNGLADESIIVFTRDPGGANELRAVEARWVREYFIGETPNLADDNGNGLTDEKGLSFHLNGNVLTVRICLERLGPDGNPITRSAETSVRLRN